MHEIHRPKIHMGRAAHTEPVLDTQRAQKRIEFIAPNRPNDSALDQ
jgi:hypothetical protein